MYASLMECKGQFGGVMSPAIPELIKVLETKDFEVLPPVAILLRELAGHCERHSYAI